MFNKTNSSSKNTAPDMSAKKNVTRTPSTSAPSILGRDISVTGDIKTDGDVQIDGSLDGNIKAGSLTIGEQGAVNGHIVATTVIIRGKVSGKIDAGNVDLAETANVQADIIQDKLTIANGAFFDGKCSRKSAPAATKPATAKS